MKTPCLLVMSLAVACAGCDTSAGSAAKGSIRVEMRLIDAGGIGASVGSVRLTDGIDGLLLTTRLSGLPPGAHGFHFHQNPDCGAADVDGRMTAGGAAGEHFDPAQTGRHAGPDGDGHAGDLRSLMVAPSGRASTAMTAARLKLADLNGSALMIHADRDDYAGSPGGVRIACGVVG